MITRVDLEDKDMIDTGPAPAVRVQAYEEYVDADEQRRPIELDGYFPVEAELVLFQDGQRC